MVRSKAQADERPRVRDALAGYQWLPVPERGSFWSSCLFDECSSLCSCVPQCYEQKRRVMELCAQWPYGRRASWVQEQLWSRPRTTRRLVVILLLPWLTLPFANTSATPLPGFTFSGADHHLAKADSAPVPLVQVTVTEVCRREKSYRRSVPRPFAGRGILYPDRSLGQIESCRNLPGY